MFRLHHLWIGALLVAVSFGAPAATTGDHAVGPQYDTTHVYVAPTQFDAFVRSFLATFGGHTSKRGEFQVTPTPSRTLSQLLLSPVGTLSVFGFTTPVPAPFGAERSGYLVDDIDAAVASARKHGARRLVTTFPDPIGRDVVLQWPGGVNMQFYWHTTAPHYPALAHVPENRIYLTADAADDFVHAWLGYSEGHVIDDDRHVPGAGIGEPGTDYRRIRLDSRYGRITLIVTDGQLRWPYGRELTGYGVDNLQQTLGKARAAGAEVLVPLHDDDGRPSAMLRFVGGYIAEVHQDPPR